LRREKKKKKEKKKEACASLLQNNLVESENGFRRLSNPIGFFAKQFSCFYKINLVNVQIFIRAEEKGKEETLIYIISEEMLKHSIG
jgi:hypothetical protein